MKHTKGNCQTCRHWKRENKYSGVCTGILGSTKIDIELKTGWNGGYVRRIETDDDFGCVLHEEINQT